VEFYAKGHDVNPEGGFLFSRSAASAMPLTWPCHSEGISQCEAHDTRQCPPGGAANRVYVDRDLLGSNLSSLFKALPPGSDLSDRQPLAPNPYCLRRDDLFGVDVGRFHSGVLVQDFDARSLGEVE
jgi:hypothetical protein